MRNPADGLFEVTQVFGTAPSSAVRTNIRHSMSKSVIWPVLE